MGKSIEVMLASPPERDELVAQLFHVDGGQWGEIYRENGAYQVELFISPSESLQLDCDECIAAMQTALGELKVRLDGA
ncbi:MAG: hypothetical protein N2C14_09490 [Planctomycetales bacterium]